jgi:uncharacterized membrane protein
VSNQPVTLQPTQFTRTRQGVRNLNEVRGAFVPASFGAMPAARGGTNVGDTERALSLVGGSILIGAGLCVRAVTGLLMSLVGGALIYRGATGHCQIYEALGVSTGPAADSATEMVYRR